MKSILKQIGSAVVVQTAAAVAETFVSEKVKKFMHSREEKKTTDGKEEGLLSRLTGK